jgi:sugar (pentulose or hexulose) kinase
MSLLVGLDVGTTSTKAVVVDLDGRELSHGHAPTRWESTADGTETDAGSLLDAARTAVRDALAAAPRGEVLGLGVASMAESGVLLDRSGRAMGPVIAWHDARDAGEVADAQAALGADEYARRTGLPLRSQWSLTKHRWLLSHDRAVAGAARRLNIAEWIVRSLGGDEVSEQSLASRTGWLDITSRDWWPAAVEWSGIRPGILPPLVTAGTALGKVKAGAGIPALTGATLTVAGHDHQVAAIGAGATGPGDELDSCGTAEALVRTVPAAVTAQSILQLTRGGITVGLHALPGHWCLLGGTQGGLIMQRILTLLGVDRRGLAALDAAALDVAVPGAGAAPTAAPEVTLTSGGRVNVLGIGDHVTPAHVWHAALTSVTAHARKVHDEMTAVVGDQGKLVVTGGWLRSAAFLAVKHQFFGPLSRPIVDEAGARGAALLAGVAAGAYPGTACLPAPQYRSYAGFPKGMTDLRTN